MSIRDALSKNTRFGKGAATAFVLFAFAFVYFELRSRGNGYYVNTRAFYSTDDGKTWFTDLSTKVPPFDKDGRQAVQAYVFRNGNGPEFVGYLQRFKPNAKQALESVQNQSPSPLKPSDANALHSAYTIGREVKRPGDTQWVSGARPLQAMQITTVKIPDGSVATPVEP